MKTLIVIAAVPEEYQLLMINHDDLEEKWDCLIHFEEIGVGPINAAYNTALLIDKYPDAEYLMLGSCGRYSDSIPLMEPISPVRHYFGNLEIAIGRGYIPENAFEPFEIQPFPDVKTCNCLTTPNITANEVSRDLIIKHYQVQIEHLESYAALKPLVKSFIPVKSLLIPVNDTGPSAHNQFIENVAEGLSKLNEYIINMEAFPWRRP